MEPLSSANGVNIATFIVLMYIFDSEDVYKCNFSLLALYLQRSLRN